MPDTLFNQLGQVATALREAERMVVDPVAFGEIKGTVAGMQAQMLEFKHQQTVMDAKIDMILDKLSEARGGWRTLMLVGGAIGTLSAAVTWAASHIKGWA